MHQIGLARAYTDRIVGLAHGQVVMDIAATAFDAAAYTSVYRTTAESGAMADGL
jgi:ABC-type phosphate/phosphonate transport system ATPase subunit